MKLVIGMIGLLGVVAVAAQSTTDSPAVRFEVASIKRNLSASGQVTRGMQPGGRVTFINTPVRQLILVAYGLQPFQLIGGPSWLTSDRFDVIASAGTTATPEQLNLMLRSLLADRFNLKAHTETREMPIYSLVKAREDGKLGDSLKPAAADCGPTGRGRPSTGRQGVPSGVDGRDAPLPRPEPGAAAAASGPTVGCRAMIAPGRIIMGGQPLSQLAAMLSNQVGRPVFDKTGLTGGYDFELVFMPEGGRGGPVGPLPPGAPALPPIDPDAPTLVTAVQEQLGLKLESERGPVEVLVIDSIDQPTED